MQIILYLLNNPLPAPDQIFSRWVGFAKTSHD